MNGQRWEQVSRATLETLARELDAAQGRPEFVMSPPLCLALRQARIEASSGHHRHHQHRGNGELPWRQASDDPGRILDEHGNPIGWMWRPEFAATVVACVNAGWR